MGSYTSIPDTPKQEMIEYRYKYVDLFMPNNERRVIPIDIIGYAIKNNQHHHFKYDKSSAYFSICGHSDEREYVKMDDLMKYLLKLGVTQYYFVNFSAPFIICHYVPPASADPPPKPTKIFLYYDEQFYTTIIHPEWSQERVFEEFKKVLPLTYSPLMNIYMRRGDYISTNGSRICDAIESANDLPSSSSTIVISKN